MSSKSFISFCLSILAVIIVAAVVTGYLVYENYEEPITEQVSLTETMELVDSYEIVISPIDGESEYWFGVHKKIHVVHDNDRNVTCWLYDDGISCIPDGFLEVDK